MTMERDSLVARLTDEQIEAALSVWFEQNEPWYAGMANDVADVCRRAMRAALEAATALSRPEQVVKALEWRYYPDAFPPMWVSQNAAFGHYTIEEAAGSDGPSYDVLNPTMGLMANCEGLPEAKVTAQADFESRIRSCLTTAAPLQADASAPASPAIGVQAVTWGEAREVVQNLLNCPDIADNDYKDEETHAAERRARSFLCAALHPAPSSSPAIGVQAVKALEALINDVQEWVDAVGRGTSWDYWDHHYKHLAYGGLDKYRSCLTTAAPLQADASAPVALDFHAADTTPDVPRGQMKACVIMMRSRHTGKNFTMPAYYLNAYPLEFEDGCGDEKCEDEHDDGCPVTGWFYDNANFEYENCYYRIEGECLAWALIPNAAAVEAALHPAPEAASAGAAATCATEGCEQPATCRFERKGVGSVYCGECFGRIVEAVDRPSDTAPSPKGVSDGVREAGDGERSVYAGHPRQDAALAALSQEPVPATAEERAAQEQEAQ